jgi:hypothetical protein
MVTGMVTGLVGYALLVLALLLGSTRPAVGAAAAFFLVAAVVGLFSQLYQLTNNRERSAEDDFGLTRARLDWTPLLSGFAGVAGVVLMATASPVLQPVLAQDIAEGGDNTSTVIPSLSTIFNLQSWPFALVIAAVFGLAPGLLINRLQREANKVTGEMASTSPQVSGQAPPTPSVSDAGKSTIEIAGLRSLPTAGGVVPSSGEANATSSASSSA